MTIQELTTLFGWMSVIHFTAITIAFLFITLFEGLVFSIHQAIFGLEKAELKPMYIKILGQYKILIFVFAFAPYLALKIIGY